MGRPIVLVAVQDSPVAFDLPASLEKLKTLTAKASAEARKGGTADAGVVVVFPEAFLSCYPRGYAVSDPLFLNIR
jgi:predicted amidohydrolase